MNILTSYYNATFFSITPSCISNSNELGFLNNFDLEGKIIEFSQIFICLGRQTKQLMAAKFQTLMLLIANAERSPLF
jgi:hypothetical protein